MSILLIEDNEQIANFIAFSLKDEDVHIVGTLAGAKKLLDVIKFRLLLVDLNLPDSRGLDTLFALKAIITPKVVLSACCGDLVDKMIGAIDYIDKADGPEEMISRIKFNISKISKKRVKFEESTFEQIKGHILKDRMVVV